MAYFRIDLFVNALRRQASFEMFIPNDIRTDIPEEESEYSKRKMKTLFLLHGYTGKAGNYIPEELAQKYNFAIVMPSGENSFYLNGLATGHQFQTFLGEELVAYVRNTFGLAMEAENTYILGMSMGGFGALHTALAYPETFGKAGAMSSALIVHEIAGMKEGGGNEVANYAYYHECFGDLDHVLESDNNPEQLVRRLKEQGEKIPEIYMCCGTEDFLLENNRAFHKYLTDLGVDHIYREGPGMHDMKFWSEHAEKIVEWMFAHTH